MSIVPHADRGTLSETLSSLVGSRFGRLTLIGIGEQRPVGKQGRAARFVPMRCDCGVEKWLRWDDVRSGRTVSCKCYSSDVTASRNHTHGDADSPMYQRWQNIHRRCYDAKTPHYNDYGGRGITVCEEWHQYEPFMQWCLANGYQQHLQIDRIDNSRGYSPDNCRFVDGKTNCRNTRRNVHLTAFGETKTVAEWLEDPRCVRINPSSFRERLEKGWTAEDAITKPPRPGNPTGRARGHGVHVGRPRKR